MSLETFPLKSRVECCGTCRHWRVRIKRNRPVKVCAILEIELPSLTDCGCAAWVKERHETFAIRLYHEIEEEIANAKG